MKFILAILALALVMGISSAVVELSGTDPAVFDSAQFAKDGVSGGAESGLTSSQEEFLKDGTEKDAKIEGMKVALVGSMAKDQYMDYREKQDIPDYATQVSDYLDERLNRSADLTIIDSLNVTNNTAEA